MNPSQPNPVVPASPTNDGVSNCGTLDKSECSKKHEGKEKASKDSNDGVSAKQRNLGMIDSLVGATYQQKLSIPIVCRVATLIREDKQLNFTITNDDEEGGLFDDIVFKSDDGDLFIQAKHKEDKNYTITWDDLTSTDKKAPFAIRKYLKSYLEKGWVEREKPPTLVLCTNIELHEDVKTSVKEYPFGTNIVDSILKSITNDAYKIDLNILKVETKNKLLDYLKQNSELGTLAKLIAQHIFSKKNVDFRNDSVQTKYRSIIENKIATKKSKGPECYEVYAEFFNGNMEFKRLFEVEYKLQLIWDDIKEKGIKLEKAKPTESQRREDENNPKRICNSDSADLTKKLAQHIYFEKDIDFQIPVFHKYRYVIEQFIATDNKNPKGGYVVDAKTFDKVDCNDFKMLFDIEYQKLLNTLKVWEDVQNKGIRLKKENKKNKSGKKELSIQIEDDHIELPKQIEDRQIEKFFKSFMIVCNTKHEEDQVVASIRESEVLPEDIKDPLSLTLTFNKLGMWILERMKDKRKKPIERQDIDELFKYIELLSQFSQWKGSLERF
ncbi:uncharacterized protein LOC131269263 [Anopheles coustani]|uniref:uncharacterized protein LOC131269263 n=1 Tax=Anopheles coustani TaxID=139045 RepID=UPI00265ACC4A|nr:uncharacterized protein LOC131269263 [Anopheles coustani]